MRILRARSSPSAARSQPRPSPSNTAATAKVTRPLCSARRRCSRGECARRAQGAERAAVQASGLAPAQAVADAVSLAPAGAHLAGDPGRGDQGARPVVGGVSIIRVRRVHRGSWSPQTDAKVGISRTRAPCARATGGPCVARASRSARRVGSRDRRCAGGAPWRRSVQIREPSFRARGFRASPPQGRPLNPHVAGGSQRGRSPDACWTVRERRG
jgi:hypothetical protein